MYASFALTMALLSTLTLASPLELPRAAEQAQRAARRIVVTVYPDLGGPPLLGGCPGCDGQLTAADVLAGNAAALPVLEVVLSDGSGRELLRRPTSPQSNGRQSAVFSVLPAEGMTVRIDGLPAGWSACPSRPLARAVDAEADLDVEHVDFGIWQGCPSPDQPASADAPAAAPAASIASTGEVSSLSSAVELPERIGLAEGSGAVKGHVFVDPDRDGLTGEDENGLGGWPVTLQGERASWTAWTAPDGGFGFPEVPAGRYSLTLDAPAGYRVLTTDRYAQVELRPGAALDLDFGVLATDAAEAPAAHGQPKPVPSSSILPRLPGTGARTPSHGPLLYGVAALTSFIGMLGLVLDAGATRHH